MRLIDADELKKAIIKELPQMSNWGETFIPLLIDEAPTVETLDTDDEPKTSRQERALEIIDALKTDRLIGNKQRGTLRRAILDNTPEVPSNMTLIPTAVLDELTSTSRGVGEWIDHSQDFGYVECPICEHLTNCEGNINELHFCWNCGALMTVSGNNET